MPEVTIKFKRTNTVTLTFNRELTEEEIDLLEEGKLDVEEYEYGKLRSSDVSFEERTGYESEFEEMEYGDVDNGTYDCIYSEMNIDSYRQYLKEEEEYKEEENEFFGKDHDYIKPHGKPLFKE